MATYQQIDWTGEQGGVNPNLVLCANPKCSKLLRNSAEDRFYGRSSGRPSDYCSDACKMKAYRQRKKALRNVQRETLSFPPQYVVAGFESEQAFLDFHFQSYGGDLYACLTEQEARATGKTHVYISGGCLGATKYRVAKLGDSA